jgi:long-chain acyl-CoA synthetase
VLPGQIRRADHTGVVHQLGDRKRGFRVVAAGGQVLEVRGTDGGEQQLTSVRDSPAEDKHLRIEHGSETRAGLAEGAADVAECCQRSGVPILDQPGHILAAELASALPGCGEGEADATGIRQFVRDAEKRAPRAVLFDAAVGTASAGKTIGNETHVTELGTRAESSPEQSVIGHDRSADACSDGQGHHVAVQPAGTVTEFRPSGRICVVLNQYRKVEPGLELVPKRFVAPVDVRCVVDGGLRRVDETGRGNAGRNHVLPVRQLADHGYDDIFNVSRIRGLGGLPVGAENVSPFVHKGAGDFRSADVNSDRVHGRYLSSCGRGAMVYPPRSKMPAEHPLECSEPVRRKATRPLRARRVHRADDRPSGTEGDTVKQIDMPAVVPADPQANITDLLVNRLAATPDLVLFSLPKDGGWVPVTTHEFHRQVVALAKGFVAAGINPGDKIGLVCKTRYEWTLIDFAAWFAGAVLVPVYETSSPIQMQWNLSDSGAMALIVETPDHFARFDEVHPELPNIGSVWQIDLGDLDKLVAGGVGVTDEEIERRRNLAVGSDMATLIYTSGSTGRPKGCVLTHSNFLETSRNASVALREVLEDEHGASTLLFITIAHVFARFIAVLCVHAGVRVGHQPDTKKLLPSLGTFKPTFLLAVPRVFEKVYNSAEQKAESGGKGKIFQAAAQVAVDHSRALTNGIPIPLGTKIKFALFDRLVYSKLRAAMGGNVKYAVSGSAPLGAHLGHFFHSLGIVILEGYGLTETTAPATVDRATSPRIGTVGPPLPGVSVRVMDDGEIQVKGVNVFQEYWKNPQATAETFEDGWLKTGDIGQFDEDGYLTITGRKKEIIVTAGGKNVAPAALEDPIRSNPLVGQVIVVGDKKPYIAALITLDPEMLPVWLNNNNQDAGMSLDEAAANPAVRAEIQRAVDRANETVSRAESIRRFEVLPIELTEASGHLTPKMSIKRNIILSDFEDTIEAMYASAPTTEGIPVRNQER